MGRAQPLRADVAIAGGGIIGLSLGLELRLRGKSVVVLERGQPMRAAAWAAGGMLAAEDPQNPPELLPLARLSAHMYPGWLRRIEELSGLAVPMRTQRALQWVGREVHEGLATVDEIRDLAPSLLADGLAFQVLNEGSIDPRDLCTALPRAFVAEGGTLLERCEVQGIDCGVKAIHVRTAQGEVFARDFVNCCGAWSGAIEGLEMLPVDPVKGQMVELRCAPEMLPSVVRAPDVYLIPRGDGRVTVGSTIERVGFDQRVDDTAIAGLVRAAQRLVPELEASGPTAAWAGFRPGTADGLPVMGPAARSARCWHATGHYRDGILLAPATARVMAQAICGETTDVPLNPFTPHRFA